MNWVRCNKCFSKLESSMKFYLAECGHIFCSRCLIKGAQSEKCIVCNKSISSMEISKNMDSKMQMFFWPIENVVQNSLQILTFQSMHKDLYLQGLNKRYNLAKKECIGFYNANKKLQHENHALKDMLKSIGYNPLNTSTPAKPGSKPFEPNMSMGSSIRFSPGSGPGSAHRMVYSRGCFDSFDRVMTQKEPSPAQMVPRAYPTPVHRDPVMRGTISSTPSFRDKVPGKSGYPLLRFPRK
ncbi:hypothetical protein HUJ04_001897 [Dendroctonus ponderosae]